MAQTLGRPYEFSGQAAYSLLKCTGSLARPRMVLATVARKIIRDRSSSGYRGSSTGVWSSRQHPPGKYWTFPIKLPKSGPENSNRILAATRLTGRGRAHQLRRQRHRHTLADGLDGPLRGGVDTVPARVEGAAHRRE